MQFVTGSRVRSASVDEVKLWAASHERMVLDLGTGDGRFVLHQARALPRTAVIGVDSCAANLRETSRKAGANARFIVADACALPESLVAAADHVNIAFPWSQLLRDVLNKDESLVSRISHAMCPGASLEIVINADALRSCGMDVPEAQSQIVATLLSESEKQPRVTTLDARGLKAWPSTWAKRLAFGRDPQALAITMRKSTNPIQSSSDLARSGTLYHPAQRPIAASCG